MSATATPISPTRFAAALTTLSLSSLYAKAAELQNSITHLASSNAQLEEYIRKEDDRDCYEALMENKEVIKRMEERIALVKTEVTDVRGLPWMPEDGAAARAVEVGERRDDGGIEGAPTTGAAVGDGRGDGGQGEEDGVFL